MNGIRRVLLDPMMMSQTVSVFLAINGLSQTMHEDILPRETLVFTASEATVQECIKRGYRFKRISQEEACAPLGWDFIQNVINRVAPFLYLKVNDTMDAPSGGYRPHDPGIPR